MIIQEQLTKQIIGAAIKVHRVLGPGLLESVYEECLCHELAARGLAYKQQVELPVRYKDFAVSAGYRIDVLVENAVVLELKAVERILEVHEAQLRTYLRLSGVRVGLLLNFQTSVMRRGILRRVL